MRLLMKQNHPRRNYDQFFSDFDQMFNQLLTPYQERSRTLDFKFEESEKGFLAYVDLPGVKKEDIKIETKDGFLSIKGERKFLNSNQSEGEQFSRTFSLPENIDTENIEAHHEDGVLALHLPKLAKAEGRSIEIQSGKEGFFQKLIG